ncbi:MAG: DEAD/DEAH box helicase [Clostridiales bacterium]|nr:DEAD/DEAH box helicase [Clostridiales bacterium]
MTFQDCHLIEPILRALTEQGYTEPTAIQAGAIVPALEGRDILGTARTGTGKTCAFATPILQLLSQRSAQGRPIRALVLTPTRELAIQNQECFEAYGKYLDLKSVVIFGGVGQNPQVEAIQAGADILVATPGRLADLYQQGLLDLSHLEIFVLDEADRMLDMGFIHDVRKILKWLPREKQTLFFSATMPEELTDLVGSLLHKPVRVSVDPVNSTVDAIEQRVYKVDKGNKTRLLVRLLAQNDWPSVLVFTRTKHGANKVSKDLEKAGIPASAIHGNKSQTARQAALSGFKAGALRVLVATDLAARGLDIEELACVINYNLPEVPETYVHRIGRTGRAGHGGIALSFCDFDEQPLLHDIEKLIRKSVPEVTGHPFPMQQTQPSPRDKQGRIINAEDQEAREAARANAKQRREAQAAQQQAAPAQPEQKSAKAEAKPARPEQKQPKQAAQPEPRQTEAAPAKSSGKKKKGKQPASTASVSELFGVDIPGLLPDPVEEPPVLEEKFDSSDILHRKPKKPERRVVPSLSSVSLLPSIELKETFGSKLREDSTGFSPSGGALDATDRMFKTKTVLPEQYSGKKRSQDAEGSTGKKKKSGQTGAPSAKSAGKQPAAQSGGKSSANQGEKKSGKKGGGQKSTASAQKAAEQPSKQGKKVAKQPKKGKSGQKLSTDVDNRVQKFAKPHYPADSGMRYSRTKDSTEQASLMKPYYLSDVEDK